MKIHVNTELRQGRSGVEARAPQLRLTSHGPDVQTALASLQGGILAWCKGLELMGELEKALGRNQLKWEPDGESIIVELEGLSTLAR